MNTLRLLTQPELTEGRATGKSDTKEMKSRRSSGPVGGLEVGGWGGEDSRCHGGTETGRVWDKGQAVRPLADLAAPHSCR